MELLLNKPYVNEGILRGQNLHVKCCRPLEMLINFEEGFRSFYTLNIRSVGQRAAKLLAFKGGDHKKVCRSAPAPLELVGLGLKHSQSLMDGNFAAL